MVLKLPYGYENNYTHTHTHTLGYPQPAKLKHHKALTNFISINRCWRCYTITGYTNKDYDGSVDFRVKFGHDLKRIYHK